SVCVPLGFVLASKLRVFFKKPAFGGFHCKNCQEAQAKEQVRVCNYFVAKYLCVLFFLLSLRHFSNSGTGNALVFSSQ
ncbi:MAG TPA: hypothetical protein VK152_10705, partial [Paludibacter sp.]|nr:hypothetical protein [Paludibacter sp.]